MKATKAASCFYAYNMVRTFFRLLNDVADAGHDDDNDKAE